MGVVKLKNMMCMKNKFEILCVLYVRKITKMELQLQIILRRERTRKATLIKGLNFNEKNEREWIQEFKQRLLTNKICFKNNDLMICCDRRDDIIRLFPSINFTILPPKI